MLNDSNTSVYFLARESREQTDGITVDLFATKEEAENQNKKFVWGYWKNAFGEGQNSPQRPERWDEITHAHIVHFTAVSGIAFQIGQTRMFAKAFMKAQEERRG